MSERSGSRSSRLCDIRLIGTYQGLLPNDNLGLQFGIKRPTGTDATSANFNNGPLTAAPLDASLQPGTGSTGVILGAYYYRPISQNFDLFINGQFQSALKHHTDQPGNEYVPATRQQSILGYATRKTPAGFLTRN